MHSWEPITNLRAKKVLCHRAEEAKDFRCCTTDCLFCNVIGGEIFLSRKWSMLMKPEVSAGCHQTLSRRWGLGTRLLLSQFSLWIFWCFCGWGAVLLIMNTDNFHWQQTPLTNPLHTLQILIQIIIWQCACTVNPPIAIRISVFTRTQISLILIGIQVKGLVWMGLNSKTQSVCAFIGVVWWLRAISECVFISKVWEWYVIKNSSRNIA